MPAYDSVKFDPPAPLARVTLRNPGTGIVLEDVPMLPDTGSDATLIPNTVIGRLALLPLSDKQYELQGFDGNLSSSQVVQLQLIWLGFSFRGQFLVIDSDIGVIGRNVLNSLRLVFDGPGQNWDLFRSSG